VLHNGGAAGLTLAAVVLMVRLSTAGRSPVADYGPNSVRV
jgi:cytochrome c oxidase assembly protein subunit 15